MIAAAVIAGNLRHFCARNKPGSDEENVAHNVIAELETGAQQSVGGGFQVMGDGARLSDLQSVTLLSSANTGNVRGIVGFLPRGSPPVTNDTNEDHASSLLQPVGAAHENYSYTLDPDISDNPRFLELKAYWDQKRGSRPMPARGDIDPLELRGHLGSLVLIDVLPGMTDFRMRLVGTTIAEAYGRDSTGKTLLDLKPADINYWRFCVELYRAVAERKIVARSRGSLRTVGRDYRHFDALLLPLDAGDGTVGRILAEQLFT